METLPSLLQPLDAQQTQLASLLQTVPSLTAKQARLVVQEQQRSLEKYRRIEVGDGIAPKLARAFEDSPYVSPSDFSTFLCELVDIFYHFKQESQELLSDEELVDFMYRAFHTTCGGSLELLQGRELEKLASGLRGVPGEEEIEEEDEDVSNGTSSDEI